MIWTLRRRNQPTLQLSNFPVISVTPSSSTSSVTCWTFLSLETAKLISQALLPHNWPSVKIPVIGHIQNQTYSRSGLVVHAPSPPPSILSLFTSQHTSVLPFSSSILVNAATCKWECILMSPNDKWQSSLAPHPNTRRPSTSLKSLRSPERPCPCSHQPSPVTVVTNNHNNCLLYPQVLLPPMPPCSQLSQLCNNPGWPSSNAPAFSAH